MSIWNEKSVFQWLVQKRNTSESNGVRKPHSVGTTLQILQVVSSPLIHGAQVTLQPIHSEIGLEDGTNFDGVLSSRRIYDVFHIKSTRKYQRVYWYGSSVLLSTPLRAIRNTFRSEMTPGFSVYVTGMDGQCFAEFTNQTRYEPLLFMAQNPRGLWPVNLNNR